MNIHGFHASLLAFAVAATGLPLAAKAASGGDTAPTTQPTDDVALVRDAFDAWSARTGGPFALLSEDARWTIVGRSAAAGTYASREAFMQQVIAPFNARLREPLKPTVRGLYRDGDMVIVLFDARGVALDGVAYENTYTWYLTMRRGAVVEVTAFFDSIAFDDLWTRVQPATSGG